MFVYKLITDRRYIHAAIRDASTDLQMKIHIRARIHLYPFTGKNHRSRLQGTRADRAVTGLERDFIVLLVSTMPPANVEHTRADSRDLADTSNDLDVEKGSRFFPLHLSTVISNAGHEEMAAQVRRTVSTTMALLINAMHSPSLPNARPLAPHVRSNQP